MTLALWFSAEAASAANQSSLHFGAKMLKQSWRACPRAPKCAPKHTSPYQTVASYPRASASLPAPLRAPSSPPSPTPARSRMRARPGWAGHGLHHGASAQPIEFTLHLLLHPYPKGGARIFCSVQILGTHVVAREGPRRWRLCGKIQPRHLVTFQCARPWQAAHTF